MKLTLQQAQAFFQRRFVSMPQHDRVKYSNARWAILEGIPCLIADRGSLRFNACTCRGSRCDGGIHIDMGLVN